MNNKYKAYESIAGLTLILYRFNLVDENKYINMTYGISTRSGFLARHYRVTSETVTTPTHSAYTSIGNVFNVLKSLKVTTNETVHKFDTLFGRGIFIMKHKKSARYA